MTLRLHALDGGRVVATGSDAAEARTGARVIIQHSPVDQASLPRFPASLG